VGLQAPEHPFDDDLDVRGPAVEAGPTRARLLVDVPAELRRDDDIVSERRDGTPEDALTLMWAIGLGRVEEGDTLVIRFADEGDHRGAVRHRRLVLPSHVLHAEPDA